MQSFSACKAQLKGAITTQYLIYFILALFATTVGAATGMGGGVIMKPVLDVLKDFDVSTINLLSSLTVLSMAIVAVGKHVINKTKIDFSVAIPLAIGSLLGGVVGDVAIEKIIDLAKSNQTVLFIQNILLALLILLVFFYMQKKDKIKSLGLKGIFPSIIAGLVLGTISSFLGIGGGPLNVALIIFVFSMPTKLATVSSLVVILFAQTAKFGTTILSGQLLNHNLSMLPPMIIGAIAGGFIGAKLHSALSEKRVEFLFNGAQLLVLAITITNILRNWP